MRISVAGARRVLLLLAAAGTLAASARAEAQVQDWKILYCIGGCAGGAGMNTDNPTDYAIFFTGCFHSCMLF